MSNPVASTLQTMGRRIGADYSTLPFRARALVCATGAAALAFGLDLAVLRPMDSERARVQTDLESAQATVVQHDRMLRALAAKQPERELAALQHAINLQRTAARTSAAAVRERLGAFVGPDETESLLTDLLRQHPGLALVAAEVKPGEPLQLATDDTRRESQSADLAATDTPAPAALFRHGLRLELEGGYLAALGYLRALEAMPWGLVWDSVYFQVVTYPKGRLVLEVHTISDRQDWLGAGR